MKVVTKWMNWFSSFPRRKDDIQAYLYAKNHPLRYWYYGHFHQSWHAEIDGVQYNMLDCMELREIIL